MPINMCKIHSKCIEPREDLTKRSELICKFECVQGTLQEEQARHHNTVSNCTKTYILFIIDNYYH